MSEAYVYQRIVFKTKRPNVFKRMWKVFWV